MYTIAVRYFGYADTSLAAAPVIIHVVEPLKR
jgi:hypothetical protein